MLGILNRQAGLDFKSWCDALIDVPDLSVIANPSLDLKGEEAYWITFLLQFRQTDTKYMGATIIPDAILNGKGIGNWENPKFIILIKEVGKVLKDRKLWILPKYRRLRPFNENAQRLKKFYKMFALTNINCKNTYITAINKYWIDPFKAKKVLIDEINAIPNCKIISMDNTPCTNILIKEPSFSQSDQRFEWLRWREKLNRETT